MALITVEENVAVLDSEVSATIAVFEKQLKYIKEQEELLKKAILSEMERNGIIKIETKDLILTYVQSTDRETFDSKAFRRDCPDMYDEYVRLSPVKPSVRIKLK